MRLRLWKETFRIEVSRVQRNLQWKIGAAGVLKSNLLINAKIFSGRDGGARPGDED